MAQFISIDDVLADETVSLSQTHVDQANRKVGRVLKSIGIDPDSDTLSADTGLDAGDFQDLALAWAYFLAYSDQIVGDDSDAADRAKAKKDLFDELETEMIRLAAPWPKAVPVGRG